VTWAGFSGRPRSPVNSNPDSSQSPQAASRSLSCSRRHLAMSAVVSASRATVRSPASDLGAPWMNSQPSWVICQLTAAVRPARSVSGRRSPQPSPRRSPAGGDQPPQGVQPVPPSRLEEDQRLGGRPDHDRRRPRCGDPDVDRADPAAGRPGCREPRVELLLPRREPFSGPDQGPGPAAGRQLEEGRDVGGQGAGVLAHVGADRGAEGRPNPLAGRRADRPPPLDGRPAGAGAGAGLGDRLVELLDVVEDRRDVGHPEPVDRDVPEVRLEIQPDVPGVAARRPRAQLLPACEPLLQPLPHRRRPHRRVTVGADCRADPAGVGSLRVSRRDAVMASAIRTAVPGSP